MTLLQELLDADLPIISADETGAVVMGDMTAEQSAKFADIFGAYFKSTTPETITWRIDRQELRSTYQDTITQLQAIEAATSPTNAQIITAIKFLARTVRLLLKLLAKLI